MIILLCFIFRAFIHVIHFVSFVLFSDAALKDAEEDVDEIATRAAARYSINFEKTRIEIRFSFYFFSAALSDKTRLRELFDDFIR